MQTFNVYVTVHHHDHTGLRPNSIVFPNIKAMSKEDALEEVDTVPIWSKFNETADSLEFKVHHIPTPTVTHK